MRSFKSTQMPSFTRNLKTKKHLLNHPENQEFENRSANRQICKQFQSHILSLIESRWKFRIGNLQIPLRKSLIYSALLMMSLSNLAFASSTSTTNESSTLASSTSDPSECPTTDLAGQLGATEDQGTSGWCYAFTAADMLTQRFKIELSGKRVSPSYLAVFGNYLMLRDEITDGGFVGVAANLSQEFGLCTEDKIEKQFTSEYPLPYIVSGFRDMQYTIKEKPTYEKQIAKIASFKDQGYLPLSLTNEEILDIMLHTNKKKIAVEMFFRMCTGHLFFPSVHVRLKGNALVMSAKRIFGVDLVELIYGKKARKKMINESLQKGQIIGLTYLDKFLKNEPENKIDSHASTIVGQLWNPETKQCEYHIRNSWGTSCESYPKYIRDRCANGQFWISEDLLNKKALGLYYLK